MQATSLTITLPPPRARSPRPPRPHRDPRKRRSHKTPHPPLLRLSISVLPPLPQDLSPPVPQRPIQLLRHLFALHFPYQPQDLHEAERADPLAFLQEADDAGVGHCPRDVGLHGEVFRSEGLVAGLHFSRCPYGTQVRGFGVGKGHAVEGGGAEISERERVMGEFLGAPEEFLAGVTQAQCDFRVEVWSRDDDFGELRDVLDRKLVVRAEDLVCDALLADGEVVFDFGLDNGASEVDVVHSVASD